VRVGILVAAGLPALAAAAPAAAKSYDIGSADESYRIQADGSVLVTEKQSTSRTIGPDDRRRAARRRPFHESC